MCFPETLRATGGIETPFTCMAPCSVTMPVPAHPQPPSPPTPPSPRTCGTGTATSRMHVSIKMLPGFSFLDSAYMLGLLDPERNIISQPLQKSTYYIRRGAANVHACGNGDGDFSQLAADGTGSNRFSTAPRRSREMKHIIHHSDCGTHAVNKQLAFGGQPRLQYDDSTRLLVSHHNITIVARTQTPVLNRRTVQQPCHTSCIIRTATHMQQQTK